MFRNSGVRFQRHDDMAALIGGLVGVRMSQPVPTASRNHLRRQHSHGSKESEVGKVAEHLWAMKLWAIKEFGRGLYGTVNAIEKQAILLTDGSPYGRDIVAT